MGILTRFVMTSLSYSSDIGLSCHLVDTAFHIPGVSAEQGEDCGDSYVFNISGGTKEVSAAMPLDT